MSTHTTGTRSEWLAARLELLEAEKELTRRSDELARRRQALPWVRIDNDYRFETDEGSASLADLFRGRSQLGMLGDRGRVQRLRRPPGPSRRHAFCSVAGAAREASGVQRRMGWTFPWASSFGGDFNDDFHVRITEEQQREGGVEYNYRREPAWSPPKPAADRVDGDVIFATMTGTDPATYTRERPGMSAFVREDGVVYHTYSAYARGLDALWGMYQWLDRAPKGRNETGVWWRRHDEYDKAE